MRAFEQILNPKSTYRFRSQQALQEIFETGSRDSVVYPPGVWLIEQGTHASAVFVLFEGLVSFVHSAADGQQQTLGFGGSGTLLGTAASIESEIEQISIRTTTSCRVRRFTTARFRQLLDSNSRVSKDIAILLGAQASLHLGQLIRLAVCSPKRRLEVLLDELATLLGTQELDVIRLALPITLRELAGIVGVTPEHLSRLLGRLEQEGAFHRKRGWFVFRRDSCGRQGTAIRTNFAPYAVPGAERLQLGKAANANGECGT